MSEESCKVLTGGTQSVSEESCKVLSSQHGVREERGSLSDTHQDPHWETGDHQTVHTSSTSGIGTVRQ